MQSREEAAEARAAGEDGGAQRAELARLRERASQLQGYELGTLDHAELMALIEQQMQARRQAEGRSGRVFGRRLQEACVARLQRADIWIFFGVSETSDQSLH